MTAAKIVMPAQAGIQGAANDWIPAPRLRGDKLRGNDVAGFHERT
jgi:hypothetical protein